MIFKRKKKGITIDLPPELRGKAGIFASPAYTIQLNESLSDSVLCVQDEIDNITDLSKIKNPYLKVKCGAANTSYGIIIFLLFMFLDITRKDDKFTYEVLLNPSDYESYKEYIRLDMQQQWKVLIVHDNQVLNIFEFKNIYNIGESIEKAIVLSQQKPCWDFASAKSEYFKNYGIENLIES